MFIDAPSTTLSFLFISRSGDMNAYCRNYYVVLRSTHRDTNRGICRYSTVYTHTLSLSGARKKPLLSVGSRLFEGGPGILNSCSLTGGDNTDRRDEKKV